MDKLYQSGSGGLVGRSAEKKTEKESVFETVTLLAIVFSFSTTLVFAFRFSPPNLLFFFVSSI